MTSAEQALLLTVARVLRAKVQNEIYAERIGDLEALNEALAPFDPTPAQKNIIDAFKQSPQFSGGTCSGGENGR